MRVNASTERLAEVRNFVADHARNFGFKKQEVADIRLAVDEAYTNIIKHAYNNSSEESVDIELCYNNNEFRVSLMDHGQSFDPSGYNKPNLKKQIKEKKRGGVGVYLIHQLMDEVEYSKGGSGNEICMIKRR